MPSDRKAKMFCGTPSYMAPEIVQRKEFCGEPADVWACGVLLYALLSGAFPFKGGNDKELYYRIGKGVTVIPSTVPTQAKRLIQRMLQVEPTKRPTAAQILTDPWLSNQAISLNGTSKPPMAKAPLSRVPSQLSTARTRPTTTCSRTSAYGGSQTSRTRDSSGIESDVIDSIVNLGYSEKEVRTAVQNNESHLAILYEKLIKERRSYYA